MVGSRAHTRRDRLQRDLEAALDAVNDELGPLQPLAMTIGDEFQGAFGTLDDALRATFLVHLRLVGTSRVRIGVGWGGLRTFSPRRAPVAQDGPAWWSARAAVDELRAGATRHGAPRSTMTLLRVGDPGGPATTDHTGGPAWAQPQLPGMEGELPRPHALPAGPVAVERLANALLACRDELLGRLDVRDAHVVRGLLAGMRQRDIADELGITQPSVAKRAAQSGTYALLRAHQLLAGLTP